MSFIQICLLAIAGVLLALTLKNLNAEYSQYVSLGVCILILTIAVGELRTVFLWLKEMLQSISVLTPFLAILMKMIGISYASEITKSICKDSGYIAVGNGIEILTRVLLCGLSLPVMKEILALLERYM